MAFPNLSDLAATTIGNYQKSLADNVTAQNALFRALKEAGNVQITGGDPIYEQMSFAENGNGGSYSGYDPLPTAPSDVVSSAQYSLKQYAVPVVFSGREELINAGKEQIIDLVEARVKVAEATMANMLNRDAYLDGTGNNGKNLTGLAAAVPLSSTNTYGGINRSVSANAFWKNKTFTASTDGTGVAATGTALIGYWNKFVLDLTRGTDKPSIIIASPTIFALFESGLQNMQRVMEADSASAGFKRVMFQGIPVEHDDSASGISTNVAYFLNTKYFKFRPHKDRNMVALDKKMSFNQDATVKTLAWAGNLTCSGAKFQGIFSNT